MCFDEGCIYEDLDLFYKVEGRDGKIAVIDAPVYFYRDTPGSLTNRFSPARLDVLKVTSRLEDFMAGNCPGLLPAARDRRLSANFNMYCLLAIHDLEWRIRADFSRMLAAHQTLSARESAESACQDEKQTWDSRFISRGAHAESRIAFGLWR